jgi:hypothetical protein
MCQQLWMLSRSVDIFFEEAQALYVAKKEAAKQAKAGLSLRDGAGNGSGKSKKSSKKAEEAKGVTKAPDQEM